MTPEPLMSGLFAGVLLIAVLHAILPTHWLSFVLVARAQRWTAGKMLRVTVFSGLGHVTTTAVVGLVAAALGKDLLRHVETLDTPLPALILLAFALYYLVSGWRREGHRHCTHDHSEDPLAADKVAVGALFLEMTLSPCESLIPLFFAAGALSWGALVAMALLSSLLTVAVMALFSFLAFKGYARISFPWLERNERLVLGGLLILLGAAAYLYH